MKIDVVKSLSLVCALIGLAGAPAFAAEPNVTYKCPGRIYSNQMTAKEAKEKGCTVLEGSVTVIPGTKTQTRPATNGGASSPPGSKIDPADQRARDSDARRILEGELKREEDRLAALTTEFNNGEPERRGDEKNFQKYADRTAELKAQIERKTSDVAAIRRELAKLPQ